MINLCLREFGKSSAFAAATDVCSMLLEYIGARDVNNRQQGPLEVVGAHVETRTNVTRIFCMNGDTQ